jgi:phosphoglycerate dehydrogenase-like enzyme
MTNKPIVVMLDDFERAAHTAADWGTLASKIDLRVHTAPLTGAALVDALKPAQVVVLMRDRTPFKADLIAQLPNLKLVIFTGTRNNTLDAAALAARNIPVCHTNWGPSKDSTTEITWALILAAHKQLETHMAGLRAGVWRPRDALLPTLHGKTFGSVGLGEIGMRVSRIAQAFGMNVVTWSPNMTAERAEKIGAKAVSLDELIAQSHVVSLHIVLSEKTKHLFGAAQFAAMQPGSIFVNTSRAGLADEAALVAALKLGRPAMAALDVFSTEPLPANHAITQLPNVVITPHLGFVCEPVFKQFYTGIVECLSAWVEGKPLVRVLAA